MGGRPIGVFRGSDRAVFFVEGARIALNTTASARLCELSRTLVLDLGSWSGVVHADRDMVMRRCAFVQAVYKCTNRCRIQGLGGLDPGESLWTQVMSLFFQHRPLRACLNLRAAR